MATKEKINVGLIGTGRMGKLHAQYLTSRLAAARLVVVADVNLVVAQEAAAAFDVPLAVSDYRELLDNPDIEAVVICSASDTHEQVVQEAASAGKHIFCEKPLGQDLHKIGRALAEVRRAGVKLQVGFNRRFDANFRRLHDMVAAGKIGAPHILRITSRDPEPPSVEYVRASGGLFLDMTIHDFDMARYLIGSDVREIFAAGDAMIDEQIRAEGEIDTAVITLRFANGAMGTIDNSRKAVYGYDQRAEVFGSKGMATIANNTPDTHIYSNASDVHTAKPHAFFLERYAESFAEEMRAFIDCVRYDTISPVSGEDGRIAVMMAVAAQKSQREGRPVQLSEVGV